ncbi:MAG: phosphoglycolate phosphatase [Burkholderiaceae bacterium]|nr:phosphoglycolate phosphatase [Burkholderiaceae bacterium]
MPSQQQGSSPPIHESQAVLIDLDGTLLDTAADLAAAVNLMLTDLDRPVLAQAQVAASVGKGAEVLVHRVLTGQADGRAPEREHAHAMQRFLHHYQSTNGQHAAPYPGVREGIEAMLSAGLRLACVTNKPQAFADPLLARQDLARCFEFIQGGDALPFKKPDPRPLLHAAARLDSPASRTVAIGDSLNDAQAARAAGMTVFIVPYGYNEGAGVQSLDVDAIVDSLIDAAQRVRLYRPSAAGQP